MTIVHDDVKSASILLDANYTAKVADFGGLKAVPLCYDQVSTIVQGTLGYLDPEYFDTYKLTDKSDVYSFGVVLTELLTGLKPVDSERGEEDINLATYFVKAERENRLSGIVDLQILAEATDEQLKAASELVCRCLHGEGAYRPSMKDVTIELDRIKKFTMYPWSNLNDFTFSITTETFKV
ncbi:putative protein kinase RLK-Pelle-WAK-LRK10L-1 family [Helianthus annuus]|nr:putative protein kinase RLK-Pelle-WAK-LRK10L-1 family [Helianthus annuus]